jgi:cytochrome c556
MSMSKFKAFTAAAVLGTALVAGGVAQAADDPAAVVEYRGNVMKVLAGSISAIFQVLEGKASYPRHMAAHAKALDAAASVVLEIFPEGSVTAESRAMPEIWTDWARFEEAGKALQAASAELVAAAEGGDMAAIGAAAGKVGDACGGCHKPFRKPES